MSGDKVPCEVYSRIVGYLRPVQNWNDGKKSEWHDRKLFDVIHGPGQPRPVPPAPEVIHAGGLISTVPPPTASTHLIGGGGPDSQTAPEAARV